MQSVTQRCKTLVIEDSNASRRVLCAILRMRGHDVECAGSIAEGMALLQWGPQCLLLDLNLPDGSGIQVLRYIRENAMPIRVAIISAAHDRMLGEARDAGADFVMRKPLNVSRLQYWLDEADNVTSEVEV